MFYHFSEEPHIPIFKPRPSPSFPDLAPAVWALDQEHYAHYCFPRDCPRVIYWKTKNTTHHDITRFFSDTISNKVIVVENGWLERIRNTALYVYTFTEDTFEPFEEARSAGYYVSFKEVLPVSIEPVGDLLGKLLEGKNELRFVPDLYPIRDKVVSSSLDFSIIRFRNAGKLLDRT